MSDEVIFYTNPQSRGRIVRWMLEEVGEPYRTELLDYDTTMKAPGLSRDQSDGQGAGDQARRYGGHRGRRHLRLSRRRVPASRACAAARATACADPITAGCSSPPVRWRRRQATTRWGLWSRRSGARMMGYGTYGDVMNALEGAVSRGDYIAGDRFTAADVYVGSHIGFGLQFGTIEKRPAFERYVARIAARPGGPSRQEDRRRSRGRGLNGHPHHRPLDPDGGGADRAAARGGGGSAGRCAHGSALALQSAIQHGRAAGTARRGGCRVSAFGLARRAEAPAERGGAVAERGVAKRGVPGLCRLRADPGLPGRARRVAGAVP